MDCSKLGIDPTTAVTNMIAVANPVNHHPPPIQQANAVSHMPPAIAQPPAAAGQKPTEMVTKNDKHKSKSSEG